MQIQFSKMHGLGNDFVIIDCIKQKIEPSKEKIRTLSCRHTGIGFDQLLLLEPTTSSTADFNYRIFNADGNEVEQCGNGARCITKFVYQKNLSTKEKIIFNTLKGNIICWLDDENVAVNMGQAEFLPKQIPLDYPQQQESYLLEINGQAIRIGALAIGNPHAILIVNDYQQFAISELGKKIATNKKFPNGTNVGFMQIINQHQINLKTYERGVGLTKACGTNACAAAVFGIKQNYLQSPVKVNMPGGQLKITLDNENVLITGDANFVFDGVINI